MKDQIQRLPCQKYFKGHVRLVTNLFPATFQIFWFFCTLQMIIFPFKTFQTTSALFPRETMSIDMDIVVLQHDWCKSSLRKDDFWFNYPLHKSDRKQFDWSDWYVRPIFFRKMFSANSSKPFLGQDNQFAWGRLMSLQFNKKNPL